MITAAESPGRAAASPPLESIAAPSLEEGMLLRETHHRLMNTFAVLSAVLRLELARPMCSTEQAIARLERIVGAHSDLHRCLALANRREPLQAGEYVSELCSRLSEAILEPLDIRCEALVDEGLLPAGQCERLGLMLCEIVLNAAKYAFPARSAGLIRVLLADCADGWRCTVVDNGRGQAGRKDLSGLGSELLVALCRSSSATITRQSGPRGTSVVIHFPHALRASGPDIDDQARGRLRAFPGSAADL